MSSPSLPKLAPFRTIQAVGSKTFVAPALDGSLNLTQMFDHHRRNSPSHVIYRFVSDNGETTEITWAEYAKGVHRAAKRAQAAVAEAKIELKDGEKPVFGLIAATDTISYMTTLMGVVRAGYVAFPISSRNSPAALAHLLVKTNARFIITTPDTPTQTLVDSALEVLRDASHHDAGAGAYKPEPIEAPYFRDLYPVEPEENFEYLPDIEEATLDSDMIVLHSSGSTAFPKPIVCSHKFFLEACRQPYYGGADMHGDVMAVHGLPPFHAIGVVTTTWAASSGVSLSVFEPAFPPAIPTPQRFLEAIVSSKANRAFVVPMFAETWSKEPEAVEIMKNLKGIIYSGGPMNTVIGDELARAGVQLRPGYGSTETGFMNIILTKEPMGEDWEYFEFSDHITPALPDDGEEHFEVIMVPNPGHSPRVINTEWQGKPAYTTNDLVVRHPTKPHLYKVYGRADDQIMLSTGEKTNPGPLESILSRDPHIHAAIMFGRGRFQNGVIVQPKPAFSFLPGDAERLAHFRDAIWKTVEEANAYAPTHSRLFKEMIIVTHPEKPFEFTPKGTPKRQAILKQYEQEIEETYQAIEQSSLSDITPPTEWNKGQTTSFIRNVVTKVLKAEVEDTDDIFNVHGADSLQVTWIRNAVLHALRESELSVTEIPQNFVYNFPTIKSLGIYISRVASPSDAEGSLSELDMKLQELDEMVSKYTSDIPVVRPNKAPLSDVVLLTGTTGALGTNLLAQLLASEEVKTVYAYNRPSRANASLLERHAAAFRDRGMDENLLQSDKLVFIEGDATKADLGLSQETFEKIRDSVTHIIHNAWRVDFNVSLSSFEPSIQSVRVMIDLALASPRPLPPRVIFTSSVATLRNYAAKSAAPEAYIEDAASPAGAGYGESKWAAERILQIASQKTTLKPIVVRVGQLCGGANGAWNAQEWLPSIVKSAEFVKCLPSGSSNASWLPLHHAASAIIDMRDSNAGVLHLAHPRPVSWTEIFTPIAKAMNVPLVSYSEWLRALEDSLLTAPDEVKAMTENPALRLIAFFRSTDADKVPEGREAGGLPALSTKLAVQVAPSLREDALPQLGETDALSWIGYWKRVGHLAA